MKLAFLISCILALVLSGLSSAQGSTLEISVTEIDNGVAIETVGKTACLVFISSLEGKRKFELAMG